MSGETRSPLCCENALGSHSNRCPSVPSSGRKDPVNPKPYCVWGRSMLLPAHRLWAYCWSFLPRIRLTISQVYNKELEGSGECEFDASLVGLHSKSGLHSETHRLKEEERGRKNEEGERREEKEKTEEKNKWPGGGVGKGCSCFLQDAFPKREVICQCSLTVSMLASSQSPPPLSFCAWVESRALHKPGKCSALPPPLSICVLFYVKYKWKQIRLRKALCLSQDGRASRSSTSVDLTVKASFPHFPKSTIPGN